MTKLGSRKLDFCPKVTKMGSIIDHRIDSDYNGVGALRGQRHIPSKIKITQVIPPPPPVSSSDAHCSRFALNNSRNVVSKIITSGTTTETENVNKNNYSNSIVTSISIRYRCYYPQITTAIIQVVGFMMLNTSTGAQPFKAGEPLSKQCMH